MVHADTVFMALTMILGLLMMFVSVDLSLKTSDCGNRKVQGAVQACLVASTVFIVVPLAYTICRFTCTDKLGDETSLGLYAGLMLVVGGGMIGAGSIIINEYRTNDSVKKKCSKVVYQASTIIGVGCILAMLSLAFIVFSLKKKAPEVAALPGRGGRK